jgi:DnaK suppressor protein
MTRTQENRFKRTLEAKRNELIQELSQRRERLVVDHASDPMDQVRDTADRDMAVENADRMYAVLHLVEGALREIHVKTFGICAKCGGKIPLKRLEAVPWSPYCVSCQDHAEQPIQNEEPAEIRTPHALASHATQGGGDGESRAFDQGAAVRS